MGFLEEEFFLYIIGEVSSLFLPNNFSSYDSGNIDRFFSRTFENMCHNDPSEK